MNTHNKGKLGEDLASAYLYKHGYEIMARNFFYQKAEIDIVARKADVLVIVEVKWRKSDIHGAPHVFVTPKKRKLLARAAQQFIERHNWQGETRFDIISILGDENNHTIQHMKAAFYFF